MKHQLFSLLLVLTNSFAASAQNTFPASGSVGIGTGATPHASSLLEVRSTTKGVLLPRMTTAQRNAIPSPAQSLVIFQTDGTKGFYYYDGGWKAIAPITSAANTALSNLASTTAVNQHLLPNTTNVRNLGSSTLSWKDIHLRGDIYLDGWRFITSKNTTHSVFIGANAGNATTTGANNTAVGMKTLALNTDGDNNTALGSNALPKNTSGDGNTATGFASLYNNTEGYGNTAVGDQAMYHNTTGSTNTATGHAALFANSTGYNNTATGYLALYFNSTGDYNTAVGDWALQSNSIGNNNTAIGTSAASHTYDPSYGTFLGAYTSAASNLTNITAVGYGARATASNQVRIGNSSVTSIGGKVGWTTLSDGRYKRNIKAEVPGLAFISKLRPVMYNLDIESIENKIEAGRKAGLSNTTTAAMRKEEEKKPSIEELKARQEKARITYTGFVAQEVEKVAEELKYDFSGIDRPKGDGDFYGLRYAEFVVPLVKAVQELDEENKELKNEIQKLKEKFAAFETALLQNKKSESALSFNVSSAYLENNTPNPFTSTTNIRYFIPVSSNHAQLIISDLKGSVVKNIAINNKGKGRLNINANLLAAGTYTYTLWVDGRKIETKQMIVAR